MYHVIKCGEKTDGYFLFIEVLFEVCDEDLVFETEGFRGRTALHYRTRSAVSMCEMPRPVYTVR